MFAPRDVVEVEHVVNLDFKNKAYAVAGRYSRGSIGDSGSDAGGGGGNGGGIASGSSVSRVPAPSGSFVRMTSRSAPGESTFGVSSTICAQPAKVAG